MKTDQMNILDQDSMITGKFEFSHYTRFEGKLSGEMSGTKESVLIIGNNSVVEGKVSGETIIVDGYVRGEIKATNKVTVSGSGKVIGNIYSPKIEIQFGSLFDGKCFMESELPVQLKNQSNPATL